MKRCKEVEGGGVQCELPLGHKGNHDASRALARWLGEPDPGPLLVHVPTVPELAAKGLATVVESAKTGRPTHYSVSKKGQRKIQKAQAHNAEILRPLVEDVERARKKYLKAQATLAAARTKEPDHAAD